MPEIPLFSQINNIAFYKAQQIYWDYFILAQYFKLGNSSVISVSDLGFHSAQFFSLRTLNIGMGAFSLLSHTVLRVTPSLEVMYHPGSRQW